ncbi:MAG: phytase [Gammaproteobacteria bacterium]
MVLTLLILTLANKYPMGLFVVQDGTNDGKNKVKRQNFKYVSFADVLEKLDL